MNIYCSGDVKDATFKWEKYVAADNPITQQMH